MFSICFHLISDSAKQLKQKLIRWSHVSCRIIMNACWQILRKRKLALGCWLYNFANLHWCGALLILAPSHDNQLLIGFCLTSLPLCNRHTKPCYTSSLFFLSNETFMLYLLFLISFRPWFLLLLLLHYIYVYIWPSYCLKRYSLLWDHLFFLFLAIFIILISI